MKSLRRHDPALQVGVLGVGAGVEDGDLRAGAVEPARPGRSALTCLVDWSRVASPCGPARSSRSSPPARWTGPSPSRRSRGLRLVGLERDAVDRVQGLRLLSALGRGRRGTRPAEVRRVTRDDRHAVGAGVVVAHDARAGDVEELLVHLVRGERVRRLGGVDVDVLADPPGLDGGHRAVLARQHGDDRRVGAGPGDEDLVAGDEGDGLGGAVRRLGSRRSDDGRGAAPESWPKAEVGAAAVAATMATVATPGCYARWGACWSSEKWRASPLFGSRCVRGDAALDTASQPECTERRFVGKNASAADT